MTQIKNAGGLITSSSPTVMATPFPPRKPSALPAPETEVERITVAQHDAGAGPEQQHHHEIRIVRVNTAHCDAGQDRLQRVTQQHQNTGSGAHDTE